MTERRSFSQHPEALVETDAIGEGTRIWAFAHILPGAVIGSDCNVCDHVFVENHVVVGDRVTVKCGVQLWDGVTLEDDVFVGPNVTFSNDSHPRSRQHPEEYQKTVVRKWASIGAGATLLPGLVIGRNAMVGAGAVVTSDVPPNAIVVGNPARISGYVSSDAKSPKVEDRTLSSAPPLVSVSGVAIRPLPIVKDLRGSLSFGQYDDQLPFKPKRYFVVYDVPGHDVRGEHAHRELHQFAICLRGGCSLMVDDGRVREEIRLDTPEFGLHIPPMIWTVHYKYTSDAVLMVLASDIYEPDDYIRSYEEFLAAVGTRGE